MTKLKKVVLSLSLSIAMMIALVIGIAFNFNDSNSNVVNNNLDLQQNIEPAQIKLTPLQTFTFSEDEVSIQKGSANINFEYEGPVHAGATNSVAYEYVFNNPMDVPSAISLKQIECEGATLSYAYSDTRLDDITYTTNVFEAQRIASHKSKYIYIVVTAKDPSSISLGIVWYQGEAGEVTVNLGNNVKNCNIVKGQQINELAIPVGDEIESTGMYLDSEFTIPATFPLPAGQPVYVKTKYNLPWDYLDYDSSKDCYYIKKGTSAVPSELIIPSQYNDGTHGTKDVTGIGIEAFYNKNNLKSVDLPNTITIIATSAFSGCRGLTSITIPSSVTSMGTNAFYRCDNLTKVYITDIVAWCNIKIDGNSASPLYYAKNLYLNNQLVTDLVLPSTVTSIGNYAFRNCTSLSSITISNTITNIEDSTFSNCTNLTSITIPSSVTSIGDSAFSGCTGLTKVDITDIRAWCNIGFADSDANPLYYAKNLYLNDQLVTDLVLPTTVTSIGNHAFRNCTSLSSITIPSSVTSIGGYAFYECSSLTSISISSSVTSIGDWAFYHCDSLTKVDITDIEKWCKIMFDSIYSNPLYYAKNLYLNNQLVTDLVLPSSVTSIGKYVFYGCDNLTSISIPNSVTSIGINAFYYCSGLTKVYITDIGEWCKIMFNSYSSNPLYYAKNLYLNDQLVTDLVLPTTVTSIGKNVFYNCDSLTSITIPRSVTNIGTNPFADCDNLTRIVVEDGNTVYNSKDDCNAIIETSTNTLIAGCKNTVIPDNITSIKDNAFYSCDNLTSVNIPSSATVIKGYAFYRCINLNSITFGDNSQLTRIGDYAFENCDSLTSITIPSSVTIIGESAFRSCGSLTNVTFGDNSQLTTIGMSAFHSCTSLTNITIPSGVTSIGEYAFRSCHDLVEVYNLSDLNIVVGSSTYGEVAYYALVVSNSARDESKFVTIDGVDYYKNTEIDYIVLRLSDKTKTSIVLDSRTTSIREYAFYECSSLTSISIPSSVTSIGTYAFRNCTSLTSITIPSGVTSIEYGTFYECSSLTSISIPSSVTSIGTYAFYGCTKLTSITFEDTDTWYKTSSNSYTGGTSVDVTSASQNATWFRSTYYKYYWYKK